MGSGSLCVRYMGMTVPCHTDPGSRFLCQPSKLSPGYAVPIEPWWDLPSAAREDAELPIPTGYNLSRARSETVKQSVPGGC